MTRSLSCGTGNYSRSVFVSVSQMGSIMGHENRCSTHQFAWSWSAPTWSSTNGAQDKLIIALARAIKTMSHQSKLLVQVTLFIMNAVSQSVNNSQDDDGILCGNVEQKTAPCSHGEGRTRLAIVSLRAGWHATVPRHHQHSANVRTKFEIRFHNKRQARKTVKK